MRSRGSHASLRLRATGLACAIALAFASPASAVESEIIVSPAASAGAEMAYAVDLGGTTLALGAPGENAIAGAAYVVDCATLPCGAPLRIAPAELVAGAAFGTALSLSASTLVVTAPSAVPSAAYVFVGDGIGWSQQAKLEPTGLVTGERFGQAVSASGDRIAVGAGRIGGEAAGAVYVFVRNGTAWTQEAKLTPSDGDAFDAFGASVALDADTLVIGAPMKASGAPGTYANGVAYVFTRSGAVWTQQTELTVSGSNGDLFGYAVDLAGDRAVIGAPYALASQGQAYVFAGSGANWSQQATLTSAAGAVGDQLGWSVALGDTNVFVGAPFAGQINGTACGASYVFDATSLGEAGGTTIEAPIANELAGWSLAASGERWVTSAPGRTVGALDHAGAAYWFDPTITLFHAGFDAPGSCTDIEDVSPRIAR
jgi:hypothetical protein